MKHILLLIVILQLTAVLFTQTDLRTNSLEAIKMQTLLLESETALLKGQELILKDTKVLLEHQDVLYHRQERMLKVLGKTIL